MEKRIDKVVSGKQHQKIVRIFAAMMIVFSAFIINTGQANAAFNGSISIDNYYDNNIFRLSTPTAAFINANSISLGYYPDSLNFGAYYSGSLVLITQMPELQYNYHSLNFAYMLPYSNESNNYLNLFANGKVKFNTDDYEMYNYSSFSGGAALNHYLSESMIGNLGYRLNYKNYSDYADLNYSEHFAYAGIKKFFETKTSVIAQLQYGAKSYADYLTETTQSRGRGRQTEQSNNIVNQQITAQLKIGQSLFESTGLSMLYRHKWDISSTAVLPTDDFNYFIENDLYDDPYSYSSSETTLTLTQIIGDNLKLQAHGFYYDKQYSYTADFTEETDLRTDQYAGFGFSARKQLADEWLFLSKIQVGMDYYYIRNTSNSEYFDYKSNSFSFSISTNL